MLALAAIFGLCSFLIFLRRKDMRQEMFWTGVFAVPIVLFPIFVVKPIQLSALYSTQTLLRVAIGFFLAALAAALYKVTFRPYITLNVHPQRRHLIWLLLGPLASLALILIASLPVTLSLTAGLLVDMGIVLIWRRDLVWDMLYSGLGMGILYALVLYFLGGAVPGSVQSIWFGQNLSGLHIGSLPVEELITVIMLGGLAGPLYLVVKERQETLGKTMPYQPWHLKPKKLAVAGLLAICMVGGGWTSNVLVFQPQVVEASKTETSALRNLGSPIKIQLNRPIQRGSLKMEISPAVDGAWSFEDPIWSREFFRTIVFTPQNYFQPNTQYSIRISGIRNIYGLSETDYLYIFRTQPVASITRASVSKDQTGVLVCDSITLYLDQPNEKLAMFEPVLDPPVSLTTTYDSIQHTYRVKPDTCLSQDTVYHLTVNRSLTIYDATGRLVRQSNPEVALDQYFRTKAAPQLQGVEPQGTMIVPSQQKTIVVLFKEPMVNADVGDLVSISPPAKGKWIWETPSKLSYRLDEELQFNTAYQVVVKPGLRDAQGGSITKQAVYGFNTIGPVHVTRAYPANGASGIPSTAVISITFDQDVDHASAEKAFSLDPASSQAAFNWSGRTMRYSARLDKDAQYSYSLAGGVKSSMGGLDSIASIRNTFKTEESLTLLSIPVYYQRHSLSCELASLKMALGYRSIQVSEETLIGLVGYDPTPRNGSIWGDPDSAFVGSWDGKQNTTGYGVHWGPIAQAASSYRAAKAFSGYSVQQAAEQLAAGNPIVVWGVYPGGSYDPWTTPGGRTINAWKGEHVRVLIGFTGKASSPSSFILNDPISGRLTWSSSQFANNWGTYGNSGVVIY